MNSDAKDNSPSPPSAEENGSQPPQDPTGAAPLDQNANEEQGEKQDRAAKVIQLCLLQVLVHKLTVSRAVQRARMTGFNVFESRQSVPGGLDYMIWSVSLIRLGSWITKRISTLSWCL